MIGKQIRLERIINRNTGRTVIVPMDHGVTLGPIDGLQDFRSTVSQISNGGADAILLHKGIIDKGHRGKGKDIGLIMHLSASTTLGPDPNAKSLVATVEEAIKYGADAVSIHINIGAENEAQMLADFGRVSGACLEWGMPLVAMVYGRGKKVKDEFSLEVVGHCARLGAELGADMVKVPYTGSSQTFEKVVSGCPVPVVIAGGPKMSNDTDILSMVEGAVKAGGAGVSIGRNAFQHASPEKIMKAICQITHHGLNVKQGLEILK
jgi:class I fructose-bisphosphate aldolase